MNNTDIFILLVIIGLFLKFSIKIVPHAHFAVSTFLGERSRVYPEGWHFTVPFLEKFPDDLVFSVKVRNLPISFTFPTKDNIQLSWEGLLEYAPDPNILYKGYPRITDFTEDDLKKGLEERTRDEIKKIGSNYEAEIFKNRYSRALQRLLESIMELDRPPHMSPEEELKPNMSDSKWQFLTNKLNKELQKKEKEKITNFSNEIPAECHLEFYSIFSNSIGNLLRSNRKTSHRKSDIEKYYGIDIQNISNSHIDYTDKMWEALESKKRSEENLKGKDEYHSKAMEIAQSIIDKSDKDITFGEAYDKAMAMLDKAIQKNISFQGLSKNIDMIFGVDDETE